jgi:hypothetical protein
VGVNDVMPQILWTRYFLEAQGYDVDDSIIYQDNQSAMLLEKNGRASSGKQTRHINICYFFVQDRVEAGEVSIQYCPTGNMIADFFTKPLQGSLFIKFRDQIMNNNPNNHGRQHCRSVLGKTDDRDPQDGGTDVGQDTDDGWTVVQRKKSSKLVNGKRNGTSGKEQELTLK